MPSPIKRFPFDGYICGCGTYAEYKDEVLYSSTLSVERSQAIIKKMEECKIDGIFEGIEDDYFPIRVSRFDKLENTRRYFRNMGIGIEMFAGKDQFAYDKLFVYTDEQSDVKGFLEFLEQEEMEAIDRQYGTYEIMPIGHSKATGCEVIRKHLHLALDQIYVFGDSSNDLPMMEYTSHAIVMGHHDPILGSLRTDRDKNGRRGWNPVCNERTGADLRTSERLESAKSARKKRKNCKNSDRRKILCKKHLTEEF